MVAIRTSALCCALLLSACGQTGPLVLPSENTSAADQTQPSANTTTPNVNTNNTATTRPAE
ncbi:Uncharacterised protein [Zhongshania aliphaticivorans]|uniref:Sugar transporter n=1 Tax=Zhongshania aliphaticivorans TaxID=1470434 RepID=A0A5S9Q7C4_9GAMM|nr:Uncharacterised protein [Zhongshania aliphaticivorans]CAA0113800.1 Uncharacterised protein [Zhongshania aliphaticivorans]